VGTGTEEKGTIPTGSGAAPSVTQAGGTSAVAPGSTVTLDVTVAQPADDLYVGVDGQSDFFEVALGLKSVSRRSAASRAAVTYAVTLTLPSQISGSSVTLEVVTETAGVFSQAVPVLISVTNSTTNVRAEATTYANASAVRITWGDNIFGLAGAQQYHVWRLPDRPFSVALSTTGTSTSGTSSVILPVGCASDLTHQFVDEVAPYAFYLNGFDFIFGTGSGSGTGTSGTGTSSSSCAFNIEESDAVTGFKAGSTYQYQVSATVAVQVTGTGTTGTYNCVESDPVTSGNVTPVNPVLLLTPANQAASVNLKAFNPTWTSTTGADEFQVEVSTDNTFKTVSQIYRIGPIFSTAPTSSGVTQTLSAAVDLTQVQQLLANSAFANFVAGKSTTPPTLYWRVGARNSTDVPGPVDWISGSASDTDTTWRWVYVNPDSFTGQL
jgi:hypothetical protein